MAHTRQASSEADLCAIGIDAGWSTLRTALLAERGPRIELCGVAHEHRPERGVQRVIDRVVDRMLRDTATLRGDVTLLAVTGAPPGDEPDPGPILRATAHARGARFLNARARAVLDLGDRHSSAIRLGEDGSVAAAIESSQPPSVTHLGALLGEIQAPSPVLITGGRAGDSALLAHLALECRPLELLTHPLSAFAGAIGAALSGLLSEHALPLIVAR